MPQRLRALAFTKEVKNPMSIERRIPVVFTGQPNEGDTFTVEGRTYTFVSHAPESNEILIGASTKESYKNFLVKFAPLWDMLGIDVSTELKELE